MNGVDTDGRVSHSGPPDGYAIVRALIPLPDGLQFPEGGVWRCTFVEDDDQRPAAIAGPAGTLAPSQRLELPKGWLPGQMFLARWLNFSRPLDFASNARRSFHFASNLWNAPIGPGDLVDGLEGFGSQATYLDVAAARKVTLDCTDCISIAVRAVVKGAIACANDLRIATAYSCDQAMIPISLELVAPIIPVQVSMHEMESGTLVSDNPVEPAMPFEFRDRGSWDMTENPPDEEASRRRFSTTLMAVSRDVGFDRHYEFVTDGVAATFTRGEFGQGILLAAQACEYLFDSVLFHMMWFEGCKPRDVAGVFRDSNNLITSRVQTAYSSRLGPNWRPKEGILAAWRDDVARARNRVIHGGRRATFSEADLALTIARDLRGYIYRLACGEDAQARYPYLASMLDDEEGFPQFQQQISFLTHPDQPQDRFEAWVACVHVEMGVAAEPSEDRAEVLLMENRSGGWQWWLYDPDTHKVVEADSAGRTRQQRREMEAAGTIRQGIRARYIRLNITPRPKKLSQRSWRSATAFGPGLPIESPFATGGEKSQAGTG